MILLSAEGIYAELQTSPSGMLVYIALRVGDWTKLLSHASIATAVAYGFLAAGSFFNQETLFTIVAALGGIILAPV